jgi:hypothetical protein
MVYLFATAFMLVLEKTKAPIRGSWGFFTWPGSVFIHLHLVQTLTMPQRNCAGDRRYILLMHNFAAAHAQVNFLTEKLCIHGR